MSTAIVASAVPGKTWEPKHSTESESIVQAAFFSTVASLLPTKPAEDLYNVEANPELWTNLREIDIDVENFYLYGQAHKIKPNFTVHLTPLTYLPKVADPRRDWVASVAVPAFIAHAADHSVGTFCTVGTGSGLDAVAALDLFDLDKLAITDLHPAVVHAAAGNIKTATEGRSALSKTVESLIARPGDILLPVLDQQGQFDLIYENLPNIPLDTSMRALHSGQTSSTYVPQRVEKIAPVAHDSLLALHWLALIQARELLSPKGSILSSMGGRVPLIAMYEMARSAGYSAEVLVYTWKIQSEPEEVIGGYMRNQEEGLGPFYFYPAAILESVFSTSSPAEAGSKAAWLEQELAVHRLDAVKAYEAHKAGVVIGHTVAVIRSTPIRA